MEDLIGRRRLFILAAVPLVTAFTFVAHYYQGPFQNFVRYWGPASVGYVVFFMLCWFFVFPWRKAILPIVVGVFLTTCGLEFLQLYKPDWLIEMRATFLGRAILGNTFSWFDFPAYIVGALVGAWLLYSFVKWSVAEVAGSRLKSNS
ncbi:MAG: hypothetical protein ACI9HK_004451 [Pirellulaceae bacterium]|jgi:hypothetical protein